MEKQANIKPRVSIGMPVYNGEQFIREALDSLLAQSFINYELIISDNSSTDSTEAICREYASKDARIRYVRLPENRGAFANFMFVLDQAVGEYFMWAAHDDRWHKDYIKYLILVMDSDEKVGLAFSAMATKNLLTGDAVVSSTGYLSSSRKFLRILFRMFQNCPSLIYGLHRRTVLKTIELQSFDYFDVYLSYWYELNYSIRVVPICLYTAGTKGIRIPYSVTGKEISHRIYLCKSWILFRKHLTLMSALLLIIIQFLLVTKNTNKHNAVVKDAKIIQ